MANVHIPSALGQDPVSILDALDTSRLLMEQDSMPYRSELLRRARYVKERIGLTTDPKKLKALHEGESFLEQTARELDARDELLAKIFSWFQRVDDGYWQAVMKADQIKSETQAYQIRCSFLETALKKELALKRQRQRGVVHA